SRGAKGHEHQPGPVYGEHELESLDAVGTEQGDLIARHQPCRPKLIGDPVAFRSHLSVAFASLALDEAGPVSVERSTPLEQAGHSHIFLPCSPATVAFAITE